MMKKFFEDPTMNISGFNTENIVTVSVAEASVPAAENTNYGNAYKHIKETLGNTFADTIKISF